MILYLNLSNKLKLKQKKQQIKIIEEFLNSPLSGPFGNRKTVLKLIGPLRLSNNFRDIITMQSELSTYLVAYAIESKDAKTVAKTLVEPFMFQNFKI